MSARNLQEKVPLNGRSNQIVLMMLVNFFDHPIKKLMFSMLPFLNSWSKEFDDAVQMRRIVFKSAI